ncbi:hypothetical protein DZF92_12840 [Clavibacter michiganensis subsp. insidiosus]|jgi:hypothetical protein|uniref:Uncharacterized protein n=1 Tax=Clavibacter michiganensis subsp. insidiosus TaxID=33014 RepID=A0A399QI33_9MICO|nr:hypothetical protein [Clavibacter michiganensis]AWG01010.1 hypothetical protein BEH62_05310 [Clavibacter michiganensis subsp. insidiosus]OQJ60417.1 hypothetical protein B5P21_11210 [Clavibacter michiganensis subsp. insidiosus]RII85832.1 hypothetical protein DZF92_12840 [Clavibacter michiganensis subsp. insidiosus]RIJ18656.1 hypothetical protein DZF93_13160 [Clavibacter michiganensis subsp. insidiosus]RMC84931.1 hypothetical protein CmiCFBP2404_09945 [Clavibacter michiganensis subsp. insidio
MSARHRLLFVSTLVITSGLVLVGILLLATSGFMDMRGSALCIVAALIGITYASVITAQRRRPHR